MPLPFHAILQHVAFLRGLSPVTAKVGKSTVGGASALRPDGEIFLTSVSYLPCTYLTSYIEYHLAMLTVALLPCLCGFKSVLFFVVSCSIKDHTLPWRCVDNMGTYQRHAECPVIFLIFTSEINFIVSDLRIVYILPRHEFTTLVLMDLWILLQRLAAKRCASASCKSYASGDEETLSNHIIINKIPQLLLQFVTPFNGSTAQDGNLYEDSSIETEVCMELELTLIQ